MYKGFQFLQRNYLTKAKLCIDSFHVIQLIITLFNNQIKEVMKSLPNDTEQYYLLKKKRFILLKNKNKIKWHQSQYDRRLRYYLTNLRYREIIFDIHPILKELYELKEEYIKFNRLKSFDQAAETFNDIALKFINHPNKEVRKVGHTLFRWKEEILNSFRRINGRRISNGPIESRNNTIKLIMRNGAGYRNFEHLRGRIIYCLNQ